jgi:uncharacterized damage-inducible protein DinB
MKKLLSKLQKIDELKAAITDNIGSQNTEQQHQNGVQESWSMIQVLSHLVTAENGVLAYIGKKMQDPSKIENNGITGIFRSLLLSILLKLPIKFKAPSALPKPKNTETLAELKANWETNAVKFKAIIDNLPPNFEDKQIFKHPVAGKFNLEQTFDFIFDHMSHHMIQLENISKSLKK